ncbi:hypothetical protein IT415_01510 [bacterium]|nr:hypothetical protein [bacterium]
MANNPQDEKVTDLAAKLKAAEEQLKQLHEQLAHMGVNPNQAGASKPSSRQTAYQNSEATAGKIIEGVFDGQNMMGPGDKTYPVPANYASKSKLVEGDILKLTISEDGSFIYKQIGPIERKKLIGKITLQDGTYMVEAGGKLYHVLFASVTYFKAQPGDEVTVVIPADRVASWAAIEAVIG